MTRYRRFCSSGCPQAVSTSKKYKAGRRGTSPYSHHLGAGVTEAEDYLFEASLSYIMNSKPAWIKVRPCVKTQKQFSIVTNNRQDVIKLFRFPETLTSISERSPACNICNRTRYDTLGCSWETHAMDISGKGDGSFKLYNCNIIITSCGSVIVMDSDSSYSHS